MRICTKCLKEKDETQFYTRGDGRLHCWCKTCLNKNAASRVSEHRRNLKFLLVEEHGSKCADCGFAGPPFMYDFDHRNPEEKSFTISASVVLGLAKLRAEAKKCDLVCALCHRMRTHKQRCSGCGHCAVTQR